MRELGSGEPVEFWKREMKEKCRDIRWRHGEGQVWGEDGDHMAREEWGWRRGGGGSRDTFHYIVRPINMLTYGIFTYLYCEGVCCLQLDRTWHFPRFALASEKLARSTPSFSPSLKINVYFPFHSFASHASFPSFLPPFLLNCLLFQ